MGGMSTPPPPKVVPMPDEAQIEEAKRKRQGTIRGRRGRGATMLTEEQNTGKLG